MAEGVLKQAIETTMMKYVHTSRCFWLIKREKIQLMPYSSYSLTKNNQKDMYVVSSLGKFLTEKKDASLIIIQKFCSCK